MIKESIKAITVSLMTLSLISVAYAWTEPSSSPPSGNISAPINTSSTYQYKSTSLGLASSSEGTALNIYGPLSGQWTASGINFGAIDSNNYWHLGYRGSLSGSEQKNLSAWFYNGSSYISPLSLTASGNVGIGTTAPGQKLQVAGTVYSTTGGFKFPDGTTQTTAATTSSLSGSGTSNYLTQWTGSSSLGNSKIALSDSAGSFGVEARYGQTGSAYSYIDFRGDDYYTDYGLRLLRGNGGRNTWSDLAHRGTGTLYLTAQDAGSISLRTNSADRLFINSSGNVGIGTTAPAYKLDVNGDINYTGNLTKLAVADNFTATVGAADFYLGYSGRRGSPGRALVDLGSSLQLNYGNDWSNTVIGGNVGIGTTAPGGVLEIKDSATGARVYWTAVVGDYGADTDDSSYKGTYKCYDTGSHDGSCQDIMNSTYPDAAGTDGTSEDTLYSCSTTASGTYNDWYNCVSSSDTTYQGDSSLGYHCLRTVTCKKEYQMTPTYVNAGL